MQNPNWKLGQAYKICGAKRKPREGDVPGQEYFCTLAAGHGTNHKGFGACKFHGGNTPTHELKAQKERAREAVRTFGLPIDLDPQEALLQELHRTAGVVAYLEALIAEFESQDDLVQHDSVGGRGTKRVPAVWVQMYQAERGHLVRVAAEAHKCGVAERQVQIAEVLAVQFSQILKAILEELEVYHLPQTAGVVKRHLAVADRVREIESGLTA